MWDTTITIQRPPNTTLTGTDGRSATRIGPVLVVQVSDVEQLQSQAVYGFQGGLYFKLNVPWYPNSLVKQNDYLIDEQFTDPDRGTPYRFRVVGRPKNLPPDHQELHCFVEVGT